MPARDQLRSSPTPLPRARREVLATLLGTAGLVGLAGCGLTDPLVHGNAARVTPSPSPTVAADRAAAATTLRTLAAAASGVTGLTAQRARSATAVAAMFTAQAARIGQVDPFAEPTPSPSAPTPADTTAAAFGQQAQRAAATFEQAATAADAQDLSLLWMALSLSARAAAPLDRTPEAPTDPPAPFAATPATARRQVLVEQLFRAIWAHQAAAGALTSGPRRTAVLTAGQQLQRDLVVQQQALRDAGATPAPPKLGYDLPQRPDADNTGTVLAAVTADVLDARVALGSSLPTTARAAEWTACRALADRVRSWGGTLGWWPGWVAG